VDPSPLGAFGASIAPQNIFGLTPLAKGSIFKSVVERHSGKIVM